MAIPSAINPKIMDKNISHTPYGVTKFAGTTFPSVLKKLTAGTKAWLIKNIISAIEKINLSINILYEEKSENFF